MCWRAKEIFFEGDENNADVIELSQSFRFFIFQFKFDLIFIGGGEVVNGVDSQMLLELERAAESLFLYLLSCCFYYIIALALASLSLRVIGKILKQIFIP